jgi:methylphosphotriester-DNA--protein-cysteine methyltransferase
MYVASKRYKIVCEDSCYHVRNIKESNKILYQTLKDAIADGCRPCKHCLGGTVW